MNGPDALEEAHERWGETACIDRLQLMGYEGRVDGGFEYRVGYLSLTNKFIVVGRGASWRAAFDNADIRKSPSQRSPTSRTERTR